MSRVESIRRRVEVAARNDKARLQPGLGQNKATASELSYPDRHSVKGEVLADLLRGRRITHRHCWQEHGSSRLAHHILMLRKAGWPIVTQEIDVPTSDGRIAQIGLYLLPAETIAEAGELGRKFIGQAARSVGA